MDRINFGNNEIVGKWNLTAASGGINSNSSTPQSTGKTIKLDITNNKIKTFENGALLSESNYYIQFGTSIYGGVQKLIMLENNPNESFYLSDNNQKLVIKEECFDCYQKTYSRE